MFRLYVTALVLMLCSGIVRSVCQGQVMIKHSSQTMYAPVGGLNDFSDWKIVAVNRSAANLAVTVVIQSVTGSPLATSQLVFSGFQVQTVDLYAVLPSGTSKNQIGGVAFTYNGAYMGLGVDMILSNHNGFGNVDIPVLPDNAYKSNNLDSVWGAPADAYSTIVLSNDSRDAQQVDLTFDQEHPLSLELPAHSTRAEPLTSGSILTGSDVIHSVHIAGTGQPGSLRVLAYSVSESQRFVDTIRMIDANSSTEAATYATGLHFSGGTTHLLVKNLSTQSATISGTLYPLASAGQSSSAITIPPKTLPAGSAGELDLSQVGNLALLDGAALKLESTGGVGSFIASFTNRTKANGLVRSVPFKDIGDYSVSTGAYPWAITDNSDSVIYITNAGKVAASFGGQILIPGTTPFLVNTHHLAAGQTAVFDMRRLRDGQVADPTGNRLPRAASSGQFQWSAMPDSSTQRLVGRVELLNGAAATSVSSTASSCSCPASLLTGWLTPDTIDLGYGDSYSDLGVYEETENICTGQTNNFSTDPAGWTISYPNVLSVSGTQALSTVTGLTTGSSNFTTAIHGYTYMITSLGCTPHPITIVPLGAGNVVPHVIFSSLQGIPQGQNGQVSVSFQGPSGPVTSSPIPITLSLSTTAGTTGSATFSGGATTMSISAPTTVTISGTSASSAANNVKLDASVSIESSPLSVATPPLNFSVVTISSWSVAGAAGQTKNANDSVHDIDPIGPYVANPGSNLAPKPGCYVDYEITANVKPANYPGTVYINRTLLQYQYWLNNVADGESTISQPDNSELPNLDINPSTSGGMAFDIDSPGVEEPSSIPASPGSLRFRENFQIWGTLGGFQSIGGSSEVGASQNIFARGSCFESSSATLTLDNEYAGDNQAAIGQTKMSYNLQ